jgi:glycosyltransferase involved in cell wall biosynthesis
MLGMVNENPLISVVCAVYNGEQTLSDSINSVIAQTYRNWELIIVNDGSKDKTLNIVEDFIAKDARIKVVTNQKNLGQTASLNEGVKLSAGEYIARIDADDTFFPDKLEAQIQFMLAHPEVALCGTNAICSDSDTGIDSEIRFPENNDQILTGLFSHSSIIHVSVLINKEKLLKVGEYNTKYHVAADYELWVRFAQMGFIMHNLQIPSVKFNFTVQSFGRNNQERNINEFNQVNLEYILWGIHHFQEVNGIGSIANILLPQHFLTFRQIQSIYGALIIKLITHLRIKDAVRNLFRFYGTLYTRSANRKYTHPILEAVGVGRLVLYPCLVLYPIFVGLKTLKGRG